MKCTQLVLVVKVKYGGGIVKIILAAAIAPIILISGCKPAVQSGANITTPQSPSVAASAPPAPPPIPKVTLSEWRKRVESQYQQSDIKDSGDGVTDFMACFEETQDSSKKCRSIFFGQHDGFRKLRFFTSAAARLGTYMNTTVTTYISLKDCSRPALFLSAKNFTKHGAIFLKQASVMVDGEVVLEMEPLDRTRVDRDIQSYGVTEEFSVIADDKQIAGLRRIADGKKVLIRLTGDRAYESAKPDAADYLKNDAKNTLAAFDRLNQATIGASSETCL